MIEQLTDMPEGAIGFRGSGKLTSRDYHDTLLPAIREELDELRAQAGRGDDAAFARFQALSREARDIEARAREVKLNEDEAPPAAADMKVDLGAP